MWCVLRNSYEFRVLKTCVFSLAVKKSALQNHPNRFLIAKDDHLT